jgi:hypothetical protein
VVLLEHGDVLGWYDVRSHHLVTFARTLEQDGFSSLVEALGSLVKDGRTKSIEVRKINGAACDDSSPITTQVVAMLEQHRFVRGYRGFVLRD